MAEMSKVSEARIEFLSQHVPRRLCIGNPSYGSVLLACNRHRGKEPIFAPSTLLLPLYALRVWCLPIFSSLAGCPYSDELDLFSVTSLILLSQVVPLPVTITESSKDLVITMALHDVDACPCQCPLAGLGSSPAGVCESAAFLRTS